MNAAFLQALKTQQAQILKTGVLGATGSTIMRRNTALFGARRAIPASKTLAGRFAKPGQPKPRSTMVTVGESPEGFGKSVSWDAADNSIATIVFLSAADPVGVLISGVQKTDTIEVVSATGLASFAEETKNEGVGAFIGLVAAGGVLTASIFGMPELAPVIGAAENFAKEKFKEEKVKTKRRDPFGEDPGSGHKAKQEGGVLISLPAAGKAFYSGNSDHKERWIKEPGTRALANYPAHVKNAFFLTGRETRRATASGDILIYPWDHIFEDNFGYYRLHLILTRGDGQEPVVE
ncbi:hypothetical protein LJR175_008357 [Variovorax sp. LjRoot175]|uniref:hypothetical protein n=1 Tax=Variovorax sp. LjRoot175 TaxID=3342276 RepID=UPI003ECD822D